MALKGYLRFGVYTETVGKKEATGQSEQFLIREFSLSDEDLSKEDDEHILCSFRGSSGVLGVIAVLCSDGCIHFWEWTFR